MDVDYRVLSIGLTAVALWGVWRFYLARRRPSGGALKIPSASALPRSGLTPRIILYRLLPLLRVLVLIALVIALSRPRFGNRFVKKNTPGVAIQILVDRSSSMSKQMASRFSEQSRLGVVKHVVTAFVLGDGKTLNGRPNDLIGISGFARYTEEYVPLTRDHGNLPGFIDSIATAQPIEDGTMIGDAVYNTVLRLVAAEKFLNREAEAPPIKSKIMILMTDGRQTAGGYEPRRAAQFAAKNGVKVYVIAIIEQENILGNLFNPFDSIDTSALRDLADRTGGRFATVSSGNALLEFYESIDALEQSELVEEVLVWREFYPYWIALALALILTEQMLLRGFLRKI